MSKWEFQSLGELCTIRIGRTPSRHRQEYWGSGHPWLSIADMNQGRNLSSTKEQISDLAAQDVMGPPVPPGTVVLSFKLSIGKVGITQVPLYTNEAIAALPIKDDRQLRADFLSRVLRVIDLTHSTDRAVMGQTLNKAKLARIRVPVPPLDEQRRIASSLDQVDALRAKRRAAIALLDELEQSIFLDMFGEVIGNDRAWKSVAVADFVKKFESGKSFAAGSDDSMSNYRILKVSAVTSGVFDPTESKPVPTDHSPAPHHAVREGDVLFSRANTEELIGAVAIARDVPPNLLLPDKLWRFTWSSPCLVEPRFVVQLFRQSAFRDQISRNSTGSSGSMKNISQEKVMSIRCGLPPLGLQEKFAHRMQALDSHRERYQTHLAELDALFASVQDRAFRRELGVS